MKRAHAEPVSTPRAAAAAPQGLELRHLRYFVAVADAGTFTRAAEQMFVAQPTLSQQIQRLEQIVGTALLHRRRDGVRLTAAGTVLLDTSRHTLSLVDRGISRTRQAAGLGRPRLRVVVPPRLPETLAVTTVRLLRSATDAADVDVVWLETPLDEEFSLIRQRQADAGLGWTTDGPDTLAAPLDAMSLGEFEAEAWIPVRHPAARTGRIGTDELVRLRVIYGPRQAEPSTYDAWTAVLRGADPAFAFADPPLRDSLPVTLAFAATASRPTAVLTGPAAAADPTPGVIPLPRPESLGDMLPVRVAGHRLTATAVLAWNDDLPRPLQQILFDTAAGLAA